MPNDFADPNFLVGLKDPLEKEAPDTANRSLGRAAVDTALQVGSGFLSMARIPTQMFRNLSDDPNGNAAAIDRGVGAAQEYVNKELISPAGQAIMTNKWMPTGPDDRSALNQPVATAVSNLTSIAPSLITAAATGGGGTAGLALFGSQGASDALAQVQDWIDNPANAEQLRQLEPYKAALREFDGNEAAAKRKLFQDSVDVWDVAVNFAVNAGAFGAVQHALTPAKKELVGFLNKTFMRRAGVGAVEGLAGGVGEGLAAETTQQRAKVKMGVQPDIDVAEILSQGFETGVAMAPGVAGAHMFRRGPKATPIGADTTSVAQQQTQAINTGAPSEQFGPNLPTEQYGPEREQFGPQNMYGPFPPPGGAPPAAGGPAGPVPPPAGSGPTPPAGPAPAPAAAAPAGPPAGAAVWSQATPEVQANIPPSSQGPAPPTQSPPQAATVPPAAPAPTGQQALTPGVTPSVLYVDPTSFDAKPLRIASAPGGPAREVAFDPTVGRWGVRILEGKRAGQFHPQLYFDAETAPRAGLMPVEWNAETGVTVGELIDEAPAVSEQAGVPAQPAPAAAPPAPVQSAPAVQPVAGSAETEAARAALTPEEQAVFDQVGAAVELPTESEQAAQQLLADEPRVATPLTSEEQAIYDQVGQETETPAPGRDKRRRERQAARKEREGQTMTDAELIEAAKTETTKRVEAAAAEARQREAETQRTEQTGPFAAEPLGARETTGAVLEEARRRVFDQTAQRTAEREAEQAAAEAEMEALAPKGRIRVLTGDIKRYKRNPTPEGYRRLRGRIMEAPVDQRDRLVKMLGEQPVGEAEKAAATPRAYPWKKTAAGPARAVEAKQATPKPQRTAGEQHDDLLAEIDQFKGLSPGAFFRDPKVREALRQIMELRRLQRALEPARQYPLPLWLKEKYDAASNVDKNLSWVAEATPYIKAAQASRLPPEKREVSRNTVAISKAADRVAREQLQTPIGQAEMREAEQEEITQQSVNRERMQAKAQDYLTQVRYRLTRRRTRQRELLADRLIKQGVPEVEAKERAAKTIPLLRSHEVGRGRRRRKITERQPAPERLPALVTEYVEEHFDLKAGKAATEKTRNTRYRARERVIDAAFRKVVDKYGGQAEFTALLKRAAGYTRDERFPEINPATGNPDPRAWVAVGSEYPATPKILQRRVRGFDPNRRDTIDAYREIEAAHMKKVAAYWKAKGEQLAAIQELQPLMNDMLKETERLMTLVKLRMGIEGRSIFFEMPKVTVEESSTAEGRPGRKLRITVGKAGAKANMFSTMVELFKANEQLKVVRAATADSRFNRSDILSTMDRTAEAAAEMRQYTRRMEQIADVVSLDLQSWLRGDFSGMRERQAMRSQDVNARFNQVQSNEVDQEGEFIDKLDNAAVRDVFNQDADPMDQLAIEEAAMEEGRRQREQEAAVQRARATQIDRLRGLLAQAQAVNDPARAAKLQELVAKAEAVLAKHNGNRRARPHDAHPPQSIKEVAREVADARTEMDEVDPDSPLISDPETAAETMDRVKNLIETGQAEVSSFVSPAFLDKLGKALANVPVLHTTSDVTNGNMYYQTNHHRLVLTNDVSAQEYAQGATHEAVHAVTEDLLTTDAEFAAEVGQLLGRARSYALRLNLDTGSRDLYGLKDASELLAEAISNEKFRQFLARVPTPGVSPIQGARNALNGLYRIIRDAWRKVMGTQRDADTALDVLFYDQSTVLGQAERLVARSVAQLRQQGRVSKIGFNRAMPPLADRFADAVKGAGPAALDAIKRHRDNVQRDRGLGLSVHSTYDLTTRAEPAFREKTSDVLDVASMIFRERTRMLQEDDQPILLKVNQFLNALSPERRLQFEHFIIDETMHSAYADAPLFTGKNKHIDQTSLADEQVRQQHADMQQRWNDLRATEAEISDETGRKQRVTAETIRDEAHKYFADRENEIRRVVVRHTLERSDVLPETLPDAQKDTALNRLYEYIFPTSNLDPDRLAEWRKAERQRLKDDYGIDLSNKKVRDQIADLRNEDALKKIEGPYFPLTRHGDYAVHGVFRIPTPDDATRYPEKVHWQTNRPIDDGTFLFDDLDAARDFIRKTSDTYGIAQIGGGEVWIDTRTGERVMEYTPRELEVERELAEARKQPEPRNRRLRKKEIEEGVKKGKPYVKKYEVRMQNRILEYHATEGEAQASINEWKAKHPGVLDINGEPEDVRKGTGKENEQYVSQQMQRVIDRFEGSRSYRAQSDADQTALKHALTLAAAKSVMRRGVRARFATRNYVKGASRDVMRNMADYSGSTAGYLAKMKHMTQIDQTSRALRDYVEDHRNAKGHQARSRVQNELLERLHEPTQSMVETPFSRAVDRILKFTMFDKLMGLGYFAVNATEPTVIAGPLMAGKHNAAAVIREIKTAYGMYGALKFAGYGAKDFWKAARNQRNYTNYRQKFIDAIRGKNDEAELLEMYNHLSKLGLFEATAGVEYQRLLMLASQGKIDQVGDYLTNMFQGANTAVENLSRFVTATAAYRLERRAGSSPEQARKYARDIVYEAHGQYANFNAPELFNRNPVFKLALQFKKYPQRIIANYIRAASGSLGAVKALATGKKPTAEQVMRARQFASMLAMQGLVAGVMGMPTEPFAIPINALHILGIIPFNWDDVEAYGREKLSDAVGTTGGELISHGVLRATGLDVSGRLSQNSMLVYGSPGSTKVQDLQKSAFGIVAGAGGSWVAELVQASQKGAESIRAYNDGAYELGNKRAIEAFKLAAPVRAIADVVDAIQKANGDVQTRSGRPMPQGSPVAAVLGLRSASEAEALEARRTVERRKTTYGRERKEIIDHWAQSSPAERLSQWRTIQSTWNPGKPPDQRITQDELLRALNVRTKASKEDPSQLGIALDKRSRPFLEQTRGVYNY